MELPIFREIIPKEPFLNALQSLNYSLRATENTQEIHQNTKENQLDENDPPTNRQIPSFSYREPLFQLLNNRIPTPLVWFANT